MAERVEVLEIDLSDIQQEARDTGKTLKDLRKEVKDLRTQLENTEMGTEDFASALDQLTRKQQELTNVTKSGVAAQKGSYNDLVNQMALLKKEWRSTADEAERASIGEKIRTINTKLKELDASLGNYQRNVGNYQDEMGQLATNLDNVSEAISGASPKIQSFNSEVNGLSTSTESLNTSSSDWVQTAENSVKVTAGITGAFQAAQGAINLMGIESEATTQMIAQMQNVMAITEGLKSIAEGIRSFSELKTAVQGAGLMAKIFGTETKVMTAATNAQTVATTGATVATNTFKKALIATGIGAIVVLIGTLIANLDKLKAALGGAKKKQEEANKALEKSIEIENERKNTINSSVGSIVGKYKLLQHQWETLKTVNEKNEWIRENASEFTNLGIAVDDVNSAQNVFITNSAKVIKALMDQAKARALAGLYEEALANQYKTQQKLKSEKEKAEQKYDEGYIPTSEEEAESGLGKGDYMPVVVENSLWDQWWNDKPRLETKESAAVGFRGSRKLQETYLKPYREELATFTKDVKDLETAYLEAERIARESAKAMKDAGVKPAGGGTGGGTGSGESEEDKWKKEVIAFAEKKLALQEDLADLEFDALQTQKEDFYQREIDELERQKKEEEEILLEHLNTKLKNEKTGEEYLLMTQEEYDKAKENLAKVYGEKIANVEKKRLAEEERAINEQKQKIIETIDEIDKRFQTSIDTANIQYEISSAAASAAGDEVSNARALQTLLEAQNQALVTKRDELLAYKAELEATGQSTDEINKKLEENSKAMIANAQNMAQAVAAEKAATLSLINDIVGSVSDSMDQLLALDLGSKWSDELGMAFSAIQTGLSKTSEALKSGQKGWQAYGEMAAAGLNATAGILNSIAEKQDETDKEGFEKQKKLQIAAATMAMLGGVVSAMTSAFAPTNAWMTIWGQAAAAAAMSALVITTGAIQIANIKKQTFDGSGGGDGGGTSTPPIPTLSALQMMDTGVQATTNIEGVSAESAVTDTKVYVVETDITNTQNNVKSTVAEATF